jgi:hypothetical protein
MSENSTEQSSTPAAELPIDGAPDVVVESTTPAPPERPPAKTARERADLKREEQLELVRQRVAEGSLVIRTMTDEERERYPPRPPKQRPQRGR